MLPEHSDHTADMSLNLRRKDLSDKAEEKLTPDSQKSLFDKTKEGVTDAGESQFHFRPAGHFSNTTQATN